MKKMLVLVVAVMFSIYFYGQDVLLKNVDFLEKPTVTGLSDKANKGKAIEAGAHSFPINVGKLGKGLYVCVIEIDGITYSGKFLKR